MVTDWRAQGHRGEQAHIPGAMLTLPGQAGPLPVMTQLREGPPGLLARESQPDPPCGRGSGTPRSENLQKGRQVQVGVTWLCFSDLAYPTCLKLWVDRSERIHFHNQNKATQSALPSPSLRLSIITCFLVKPGVFFNICCLC